MLEYLHGQSPPVIFRDLKPGNVMVTPDGAVKLIDFGIARIFKPGKTTDTAYFGTTGYAPKEQYGKGQTDTRSDVYGLGATLHHLLTGADPADNPFYFGDIRQLNERVDAHVADCITQALADDPGERWQSVTEMKAALAKEPASRQKSRPKVSAVPQMAAVAASARAGAVPQPVAIPSGSRLNLWRGLGLALLGAALQGAGQWATIETGMLWEYDVFAPALFAFIPALFGVLFGPWVGGFAGALGSFGWRALAGWVGPDWWGFALSYLALGILAGLIAKDARNWKTVLGAGVAASGAHALVATATVGAIDGWWRDFWGIIRWFLIPTLLPNILLLPLLARWLVGPVRRQGLYWRDYH